MKRFAVSFLGVLMIVMAVSGCTGKKPAEQYVSEQLNCSLPAAEKYNHWIDTIYEGEVLVVDKDHEDFVSNPAVLERICARLDALKAKK